MRTASTDLDRFLRAVHRRWVVVRVAEAAGVGAAAGCGLALLVLPIVLWRGEPALPIVVAAAAVAALAGAIAGVIRRPTLASAAAEADRQLSLADLLSTALATRDRAASDPWAAVVVATASARCRTLAPGAVIVNRFGGRAWGGIGLTTALALTLALMSADPNESAALAPAPDEELAAHAVALPRSGRDSARAASANPTQRNSASAAEPASERETPEGQASANVDGQASRASSAGEGGGAGLATSSRLPAAVRPQQSPHAGSRSVTAGDPSAGGASGTQPQARETADSPSSASTDSALANHTPAWRSPAWPAARDEALSAVRDGAVRSEYRDLVREYFDRTEAK